MSKFLSLIFICFFACSLPQKLEGAASITGTITDSLTGLSISRALVEAVRGGQV